MKQKIGIIVNPIAGRKSKTALIRSLKELLDSEKSLLSYDIWETEQWGQAASLAQNAEQKNYSDLIVVGGDGTLHEAVNGLTGQDIAVSVIPTGTGNDFVKSVPSWPDTLEAQVRCILAGNSQLIDLGVCNDKKFVNTMGLGFDGEVVDFMERHGKLFQGHLAYLYTVIKTFLSYQEPIASMELGGKLIKAPIFMTAINNGTTFGGGFLITPEAKLDDGILDVCIIEKLKLWERIVHIPKVQKGIHHSVKGVSFHQVTEMQVHASTEIIGQIDGEYLGHPPFNIKVLPKSLRIRVA